jgi:hypothetical protein
MTQIHAQASASVSLSTHHSGCIDPSNPTNASTRMEAGRAVFENDNYRITAGDNNEVNIHNKETGENYQVWGDPHVNVDGQHAFDFWGTTSFKLDDGTKLTIETTPSANDPSTTLASKVTITNGDYGVQISGVDTNKSGDLKIDEAKGWGQLLDGAVSDGNVLHENPAGKGFLAVDDNGNLRKVDQNYINQTDLQKGGADKLQDQFKDAFKMLGGLLSISFMGAFLGAFAGAQAGGAGCGRDEGTPPWRFDETGGNGRGNRFDPPEQAAFASVRLELTLARWQA